MPTYLCHGFRWHRRSIRYFIVIQDLEDAAPEWIVGDRSSEAILEQFYVLFDYLPPLQRRSPLAYSNHKTSSSADSPRHSRTNSYDDHDEQARGRSGEEKRTWSLGGPGKRNKSASRRTKANGRGDATPPLPSLPFPSPLLPDDEDIIYNECSAVKLLEEFDPSDVSRVSGPWAYVADHVVRVDTSVLIAEEISRYEALQKVEEDKAMSGPSDESGRNINTVFGRKGWFEKLRDQLQKGESIRWYVVVCGDEDREHPDGDLPLVEEEDDEEDDEEPEGSSARASSTMGSSSARGSIQERLRKPVTPRIGVVENGFEFRIPELAGLAQRPSNSSSETLIRRRAATATSTAVPETTTSSATATPAEPLSPPPVPKKDYLDIPLSPNLPVSPGKADSSARPKTPKSSSSSIRRLFSRNRADSST